MCANKVVVSIVSYYVSSGILRADNIQQSAALGESTIDELKIGGSLVLVCDADQDLLNCKKSIPRKEKSYLRDLRCRFLK